MRRCPWEHPGWPRSHQNRKASHAIRHGAWYLLGLIRAGWARGWPSRLGMLAAALAVLWFVVVPAVTVALAHLGYIVALLAGIYGGSWIVGKVLGPVPVHQALQELLLLVLLVWVLSLAVASRLTYRLTRRAHASR